MRSSEKSEIFFLGDSTREYRVLHTISLLLRSFGYLLPLFNED